MAREIYQAWSSLLSYPGDGAAAQTAWCIDEINRADPERREDLEAMREYSGSHDDSDLEETFVRTFENNAERALELGWHLYGESYSRGSFMVRIRQLLRDNGIEESVQLPDHLTHILSLLSVVDDDSAGQLAKDVLLPALTKIEAGFSQPGNPYHGVIAGLSKHLSLAHATSLTHDSALPSADRGVPDHE